MPVWGMVIQSSKRYKQVVERPYKITRAVLNNAKEVKGDVQFLLTIQGVTYIAFILNAETPQCALDLQFTAGDAIELVARSGHKCEVHITGYITDGLPAGKTDSKAVANGAAKEAKNKDNSKQKNKDLQKLLDKTMSDSDSDDMDFSALLEGEDSDDDLLGEEEDDDEEMGDDDSGDEEGGDEEQDDEDGEEEEDDDEDDDDDEEEDSDAEEEEEEVKPPPSKKKKENAKQQQQQQQEKKKDDKKAAQTNGQTAAPSAGKEQVLAGGVKIKDVKEGTGAFAKPGKTVAVYYQGRLQGKNKIFDSCSQGAGFKFALGRGTVIRGWDTGVAGMRVGGKRTITCPPNMAYGAKGQPPVIPPNSTLVFDVELRNVL